MKVKVKVELSPKEMRKILGDTETGRLYDRLKKSLVESYLTEKEADGILAPLFLDVMKKLMKEQEGKTK